MDRAVKFIKEYNRMCRSQDGCRNCPILIHKIGCFDPAETPREENEYSKIVEVVEKWSRENPDIIGKKYIIEIDMVKHDCGNKLYHVKDGPWVSEGTIAKLEEYKESEK